MTRLFYRAYPAFYLDFYTLDYQEFSRVYPFPFENVKRLYSRVLTYFPCKNEECLANHPIKHYAFLVLNCPEIRKEIYIDKVLSSNGFLSLETILDSLIDVIWDLEPDLYEEFEKAVRDVPHVKTDHSYFDRCNSLWYEVKDSLTAEVDPLVARYVKELRI